MWDNFVKKPINVSVSCDFSVEEKRYDTKMKIEKSLSLESDTDFQSFRLPLEQDFTKSSKGYASRIVTIPDKEIKSVSYENKLEESEIMLHRKNFSVTNYLENSDNILINPTCSFDYTNNSDNLCYKKCTKIAQLENIEDYQHSKTSFTKIIEDNVSDNSENIVHLTKCPETSLNFSVDNSNLHRFNDKSDDYDSSESSETDCSISGFNDSINFGDSSSDDSVVFSEDVIKWCQTMENKETLIDSSENSNTGNDSLKESKENTSVFLSENFVFDLSVVNLQESCLTVNRNFHNLLTSFSSEGYVNASFEDDDFLYQETSSVLKSVNESWNNSMKNITEEPHISKKVSFVPMPDLVSVYTYEPEGDDYCYSLYVLDQLRFQNRIKDFESIISPYLTPEHRARIYLRNCHKEIYF